MKVKIASAPQTTITSTYCATGIYYVQYYMLCMLVQYILGSVYCLLFLIVQIVRERVMVLFHDKNIKQ